MSEAFRKIATHVSVAMGSSRAFLAAVSTVVVWAATGPLFGFSDTWQLVINTGTTIVTFLMVFLIQNAQNRDARVIQLKLDELLRAVEQARTSLVDVENSTDAQLDELQEQFHDIRKQAQDTSQNVGPKPIEPSIARACSGGRRLPAVGRDQTVY
jgi:low affinity Fe/Cu permease